MVSKRKKTESITQQEVKMATKRKKTDQTDQTDQNTSKSWKNIAYFNEYQDADKKRVKLLSENDKIQVKVKRCGPAGLKYVVKLRKNPLFEEKVDKKGKKQRKKGKNKKVRA